MNNLIGNLKNVGNIIFFNSSLKQLKVFNNGLTGTVSKRNTYILKRRFPVNPPAKGKPERVLKGRHFVYDLIENTETNKQPLVQVVLKKFIEGLGQKGDVVSVKKSVAYNKLLLTGLADYATPDAIERGKLKESKQIESSNSSPFAPLTVKFLEAQVLNVVMNKETEWTLEPWHIRVSFRKAGMYVPTECLELPSKPIKGPNLNLEMKDFIVTVTINNREKANVRCRIHHWSTHPGDRLPYVKDPWTQPTSPIFEEDSYILSKLSLPLAKKDPPKLF